MCTDFPPLPWDLTRIPPPVEAGAVNGALAIFELSFDETRARVSDTDNFLEEEGDVDEEAVVTTAALGPFATNSAPLAARRTTRRRVSAAR